MKWIALVVLALAALTANLCLGDVNLSPQAVLAILSAPNHDATGIAEIIWQIRLPRILIACLVGTGLSLSGCVLQALSRNSLADPYLTGVSSGAGLAVALSTLLNIDFSFMPLAAFSGGIVSSSIVAGMSRSANGFSVSRLLLAGVGLSAICGAAITLVIVNATSAAQGQGLYFWLAGGIAGRSWSEVYPTFAYITAGALITFLLSKQIRLLKLGPEAAQALGLDVERAQWALLGCAVLLCGAAVSVSGLVGFVGLIAPHLARSVYGRDERVQLVCASIIGMTLVLLSDLASRTLGQGQELPLGTLLSLVGGPFFLWQISRSNNKFAGA